MVRNISLLRLAILVLGLVAPLALSARPAAAQICAHTPPDRSICPADMPAAATLDPVFLIGSASGDGYYGDCGLIDQLVACGWSRDRIFPIYREADADSLEAGARAMFAEVETIRRRLGATKIDLFGYSIGGPRIWTYLTMMDGWRYANQVVLWASPNYGLPYTPYTRAGLQNVVLPWHREITETSEFNACVQGRSNTPSCPNPFSEFPPRAITAAEAASGRAGITYYNLYSADQPCHSCTCTIWCDAPGVDPREAHPNSDMIIPAENSELPKAYNIRTELVAHWDFIQSDPRFYSTGFRWLERHGGFRPSHNDVWQATMLGFLGRDPAAPSGGLDLGGCGEGRVSVSYGVAGASAQACEPVRCGTLTVDASSASAVAELWFLTVAAGVSFVAARRRLRA